MSKDVYIKAYSGNTNLSRYVSFDLNGYDANGTLLETITASGTTNFYVYFSDDVVSYSAASRTISQTGMGTYEYCCISDEDLERTAWQYGATFYVYVLSALTATWQATLDGVTYTEQASNIHFWTSAGYTIGGVTFYRNFRIYDLPIPFTGKYPYNLQWQGTFPAGIDDEPTTNIRIDYDSDTVTYVFTTNMHELVIEATDKDDDSWSGTLDKSLTLSWGDGAHTIATITSLPVTLNHSNGNNLPSGVEYALSGTRDTRGPTDQVIVPSWEPPPEDPEWNHWSIETTFTDILGPYTHNETSSHDIHYNMGVTVNVYATLDGVAWSGDIEVYHSFGETYQTTVPETVTFPYTWSGLPPCGQWYWILGYSSLGPSVSLGPQGYGRNQWESGTDFSYGSVLNVQLDFCTAADVTWTAYLDGVEQTGTIAGIRCGSCPDEAVFPYNVVVFPGTSSFSVQELPDNLWVESVSSVEVAPGESGAGSIRFRTVPSTQKTYHIKTWNDLLAMREDPWGKYVLDNDIDASASSTKTWNDWPGITGWVPLGWAGFQRSVNVVQGLVYAQGTTITGEPFHGTFDGNKHTISHLSCAIVNPQVPEYTGAGGEAGELLKGECLLNGVGFIGLYGKSPSRAYSSEIPPENVGAIVKNVSLTDVTFDLENVQGNGFGLLLGGNARGGTNPPVTVSKCSVEGTLATSAGEYSTSFVTGVGGILGGASYDGSFAASPVHICGCTADFTANLGTHSHAAIGGLVGGCDAGFINESTVTSFSLTISHAPDPTLEYQRVLPNQGYGGMVGIHYPDSGYYEASSPSLVCTDDIVEQVAMNVCDASLVGGFIGSCGYIMAINWV